MIKSPEKTRLIKVALYKNSKSFFGGVIRFQQKFLDKLTEKFSGYSHAELVFENGTFFSSSEEDGGTRFKNISPKKNHWDFVEIPVTEEEYQKILEFCISQNGKDYNWAGIFFSQALRTRWTVEMLPHGLCNDWFCSQIVTRSLQEIGMLAGLSALFTNPGLLAFELDYYLSEKK